MPTANPQYVTLTPNTVTTVDVSDSVDYTSSLVKVTTDDSATAPIYFRADGVTPTVAGNGSEVVLAGGRNYEVASISKTRNPLTGAVSAATVQLISAAAAWVKVEVIPVSR